MEPADPFTIQGRPYIDQRGDFAVLKPDDEETSGRPIDDEPDDVAKVIKLVESNPATGLPPIRRATGFGYDRITRILNENGWRKENGVWTQQLCQPVASELD